MFTLKINNSFVELDGFNIVRKNPIFNSIGDYTEPFSMPGTDINKKACGMVHPAQAIPASEPDAEIAVFNEPYLKGSAIFENAGDAIGGYIMAGKSHFYSMVKNKNLSDLSCSGIRFPNPAGTFATPADKTAKILTMALTYPSELCDIVAFPVTVKPNNIEQINQWYFGGQTFYAFRMAPFIRLTAVLRFIFAEHGYVIRSNYIMDDDEWKTAVVFNNVVADDLYYEPDGITAKNWGKHLPAYSIKDFIQDVERITNTTFHINNATKEVNIIHNGHFLSNPSHQDYEQYRTEPIAKKRISGTYGRSWSWAGADTDEFAVTTDLSDIVVEAEVNTEDLLPAADDTQVDKIYLALNTDTYWRYTQSGSTESPVYGKERIGTRCGSLKTGLGSYNKSIGLYPLPMHVYTNTGGDYNMLCPCTHQDQLLLADAKHLPFEPSILFFRGMADCIPEVGFTDPVTYPLGSMYKHDTSGTEIQGLQRELATETLENDDPLLNSWYDSPREYLSGNMDIMPWSKLKQIELHRKYTFNGLDYVFDEIKTAVDTQGIETIEYGAYRV